MTATTSRPATTDDTATLRRVMVRMWTLAQCVAHEPRDVRVILWLEEFAALGWQIGLDVPPPAPEVERVLADRLLLLDPYCGDPDEDPDEHAAILDACTSRSSR